MMSRIQISDKTPKKSFMIHVSVIKFIYRNEVLLVNINQLETFLMIEKTMSFRKTAELLNLTQPAVSAQIRSLEEELGVTLITRSQPISLTDAGLIFVDEAGRIVAHIEQLKQRLDDIRQMPQGHIRIGTTTSIAMQILPRVLSYVKNQYPLIKTTIHSMPSTQIKTAIENGTIDLGIGYLLEKNQQIESSILYYDTFELVVSPHHSLAGLSLASAEHLRDVPFIMLAPETAGRRFAEQVFERMQLQPDIIMELSSSEEVKRMVELNLGAAIISKLSVANEIKRGTLKMISIDQLEITHPVAVMFKSGRYISTATRQFLNDLKGMPESQFLGSE
jgi:DNA-binding transcriptional LysR family regulator